MIMSMYKKICITNRILVNQSSDVGDTLTSVGDFTLFLNQIERVAKSGVDVIILREKDLDAKTYEVLAKQVIVICERYNVLCVLHTFIDVALHLNHPHIHVPYGMFLENENMLSDNFETIGVSTHALDEVLYVEQHGASYVTLSPIYETTCKPGVTPKGLTFLENVSSATKLPVYALGGINEARMEECAQHGAAGVCMMSEYMKF